MARIDYEDLVNVAYLGLVHAYNSWQPDKGAFTTIALRSMNQYVAKYITKNILPFSCGSRFVDLEDIKVVFMDSVKSDDDFDYHEIIGMEDSDPKIKEIIDIAKKISKNNKQFEYWYRRYIEDEPVIEIAKEDGISKSRVHTLIKELNEKIRKIYFQ